jgi:hypothetical protein
MARFQNLCDEGESALTLQHSNSCAAAWKRVRIAPAASRHAQTTPNLIASRQNIKNRVNSLKTNEKIFSNR